MTEIGRGLTSYPAYSLIDMPIDSLYSMALSPPGFTTPSPALGPIRLRINRHNIPGP